jgi:hypothetical protein
LGECKRGACGEGIVDDCYHAVIGIRRVQQQSPDGCGIATLAMLTDQTYEAVLADLKADPFYVKAGAWHEGHSTNQGVLEHYLGHKLGWFHRVQYEVWVGAEHWPPEPFAPLHWAQVIQESNNAHFVAMDSRGVVYDPLREGVYRLTDWSRVNHVMGWIPLGRQEAS